MSRPCLKQPATVANNPFCRPAPLYNGERRARRLPVKDRSVMTDAPPKKTGLGNYFVANYPPFSAWQPSYLPDVAALSSPPRPHTPLGLYLHIPSAAAVCSAISAFTPTRTPATSKLHPTPSSAKSSCMAECLWSGAASSISSTSAAARRPI
ncbi:MAG: hypothetical protein U0793_09240 [Gemmataceae bacterium]